MIAKLSALLFFALLIAISVVVFGRLSKRLVFDIRATVLSVILADPGVNLSVLEITACVSRTNISDGHPNKNSNDRRSDSNGCCHIVFLKPYVMLSTAETRPANLEQHGLKCAR
jgi:hypothetical protein